MTDIEEGIRIGYFSPQDAEGLVELFRAVYGDSYPVRIFYDRNALVEANEAGTYHSIVARNADNRIVGAHHLFRSAPHQSLYELGAGLVLMEYRKLGLNRRMLDFVFEQWAPQRQGIEETWGEAVCNHLNMQKRMVDFRHVETALELALMPAEAYEQERSAVGRVAAICAFRCYRSNPHTVYLPPVYEEQLTFLYSGLDDQREVLISDASLPDSVESHAEVAVFDFAQVCRITVWSIGRDFDRYIKELEAKALARKVVVLQVRLNLGCSWVGAAVNILKERGYFIGGLAPRWFNEDGLLMQRLLTDPNIDNVRLYSDRSKQILGMVQKDWLETGQG